jgi:hypothetical protein
MYKTTITKSIRLSTSTTLQSDETIMYDYILGIGGSSVQKHVYSVWMWFEIYVPVNSKSNLR